MAEFVKVAKTAEIEPGGARLVEVNGKQIALFNVEGQFFAIDNTCSHKGGPLAEGEVSGHVVIPPSCARASAPKCGSRLSALPAMTASRNITRCSSG